MDSDLAAALRSRKVDVVTALDTGMIGRSDEDHLAFAAGLGRVLYSFNLCDFYRLHMEWTASGRNHAGRLLAQQQRFSVGEQLRRILRLRAAKSAEQMQNQIEFLSNWR